MSRTVINTSAVEFDVGSPTSEACPIDKKETVSGGAWVLLEKNCNDHILGP